MTAGPGALPTILLTGATGQLGCELAACLAPLGNLVALDHAAVDLADADAVRAALRAHRPQLIVNAGAYTAVDQAEHERDRAFAVNATAPGVMAEHARANGALMVHYSTDYVFDGRLPHAYDEQSPTHPLNAYGASKLAGEQAIAASGAHALVLRTSWVYGLRGRNFLRTMQRLGAERDTLDIVDDQVGTPNWCRALARASAVILARGLPYAIERAGLYHLSARGSTTWFGFARAIFGDRTRPQLRPIPSSAYPTPAQRPANSMLDTARFAATFGFALPQWRASLADCLAAPAEPPLARMPATTGDL